MYVYLVSDTHEAEWSTQDEAEAKLLQEITLCHDPYYSQSWPDKIACLEPCHVPGLAPGAIEGRPMGLRVGEPVIPEFRREPQEFAPPCFDVESAAAGLKTL